MCLQLCALPAGALPAAVPYPFILTSALAVAGGAYWYVPAMLSRLHRCMCLFLWSLEPLGLLGTNRLPAQRMVQCMAGLMRKRISPAPCTILRSVQLQS